jgi:hypothetical protein
MERRGMQDAMVRAGKWSAPLGRRQLLRLGAGCLGLSLPQLLALQSRAAEGAAQPALPATPPADDPLNPGLVSPPAKAKSIIHIFLPGALSTHESWDPKPEAESAVRGEFAAVKTAIPGVLFSETLTKTAAIADRLTLLRSVWHSESAHERGVETMLTGWQPSPAITYPCMGSIVAHELGGRNSLPPYVCIPDTFGAAGYLSDMFGPFSIGGDPAQPGFRVRNLALPKGVDAERFAQRQKLRTAVENQFTAVRGEPAVAAMGRFYEDAYAMIASPAARDAFSLDQEPDQVRDAFGRNSAGQGFLLARRLVAAGVRFVTVQYGSWDHHANLKPGIGGQLPPFDQAFAALIADLASSGRLAETLVVVSSDFGRTPRINAEGGRDHWTKCFTVALAGAGLKPGYVHGASDATGAEPLDGAVHAKDYAATLFHLMGIAPEKRLLAQGTRPIAISDGEPIKEILA